MWIEPIFYLVFISQLFLISYYYPSQILQRINYVFKHYPADKYAKLYPKGYEKALEDKFLYKYLNVVIFVIGLLGFSVFVVGNVQGNIPLEDVKILPLAYGLLQAIPFLMLELSGFKKLKLMRNLNQQTKRQADLSPRHIFNYLSPTRLYTAVLMFFMCIFIILSGNNFDISLDEATLIGALLLCNGLFVGLGYVLLKGKKLDPHQSAEDRQVMTKAAFHSYTSVSILVSVFFIINRCVERYALDSWEPVLNSLYWQAVILLSTGALLKFIKLESLNYEVYKTTPSNNH